MGAMEVSRELFLDKLQSNTQCAGPAREHLGMSNYTVVSQDQAHTLSTKFRKPKIYKSE